MRTVIKRLAIIVIVINLVWAIQPKMDNNNLERFTGIFGFNFKCYESQDESLLISVKKEFGNAHSRISGDASTGLESICYLWPDNSSVLIFEEEETGVTFRIRKGNKIGKKNWFPLSSSKLGEKKLEVSGLKLGLTKTEVKNLIGKPTKTTKDKFIFEYAGDEKFSARALKIRPSLDSVNGFWHQILITTIFSDSILTEFSVYESEQN